MNNSDETVQTEFSDSVEHSQLLALLNEEILQIQNEESRPGWSIWAVYGVLATCVWILIEQIEKITPQWEILKIMFIALSYLVFSVLGITGLINNDAATSQDERLVPIKQYFYKSKMTLYIMLLWASFISYCILTNNCNIYQCIIYISIILLFVIIMSMIVGLVLSSVDFFTPDIGKISSKRIWIRYLYFFYFGIGLAVSVEWGNYLFENNMFLLYELKISLLISTILVLVLLSVSLKSESGLLINLIELRRDLLLGTLPIEQIRKQTELLLRGLKVQDYYSKEIGELLTLFQLFEKELFQAIQKIDKYENNEIESLVLDEKRITQDALKVSILNHLTVAAKIKFTNIEKKERELSKKIKIILIFFKIFKIEFTDKELVGEVYIKAQKYIQNYNDTVRRHYQVLEKTNGKKDAQNMISELCANVPNLKYDINTGEVAS